MCMVTQKAGWSLEYTRAVPLFQLLQLVAGWMVWEGNDLKWAHAAGDRKRLRQILNGHGGKAD